MSPTEPAFWDAVDGVRAAGSPYPPAAYGCVVAALSAAVATLPAERRADPERRHLSGRELLASVVALARAEFGFMAATTFREWGVTRGEDVGRIVFDLVGAGQLSARPEDTMDDFTGVPDLLAAVDSPLAGGPPAARPAGDRPGA